jgi:hypothetical protein
LLRHRDLRSGNVGARFEWAGQGRTSLISHLYQVVGKLLAYKCDSEKSSFGKSSGQSA